MPLSFNTANTAVASLTPRGFVEGKKLTPEQDYLARAMGEEELELLRAAASHDGLQLAALNWILAHLANHGFINISSGNDRRMLAVATWEGHLVLAMRPMIADDSRGLH